MFYVYFSDDYADNGGVGLDSFELEDQAISFIEKRISKNECSLNCYTLIYGYEIKLKSKEKILSVERA